MCLGQKQDQWWVLLVCEGPRTETGVTPCPSPLLFYRVIKWRLRRPEAADVNACRGRGCSAASTRPWGRDGGNQGCRRQRQWGPQQPRAARALHVSVIAFLVWLADVTFSNVAVEHWKGLRLRVGQQQVTVLEGWVCKAGLV